MCAQRKKKYLTPKYICTFKQKKMELFVIFGKEFKSTIRNNQNLSMTSFNAHFILVVRAFDRSNQRTKYVNDVQV